VRITKNSVRDNGTIGIDLQAGASRNGNGVDPNDVGDADGGTNGLQNFRSSRRSSTSARRARARESWAASTAPRRRPSSGVLRQRLCLDFPRDFLEGETFIGTTQVTTDASGVRGLRRHPSGRDARGNADLGHRDGPRRNTSEFSQRIIFSISPASGPAQGGTPSNRGRTNFTDPTTITFGGVAANVTFVDDQHLTTASPALPPGTVHDVVAQTAANIGVLEKGLGRRLPRRPRLAPVPFLRDHAGVQRDHGGALGAATTAWTSRRCASRWPSSC
jgi:hypothetical protein